MKLFPVVFAAELRRRLRSRVFLISTVLGMALIALIAVLPQLLDRALTAGSHAIVLAGPASLTTPAKVLLSHDFTITGTVSVLPQPVTAAWLQAQRANAAMALANGPQGLQVDLYATDLGILDHAATRELIPLEIALRTHVDVQHVVAGMHIDVRTHGVGTRFADENAANGAQATAYGLILFLYMGILINGQAVMASVGEEKTNRIAELLISTMRPSTLLCAKIAAVGAAGALQLLLWFLAAGSVAGNIAESLALKRASFALGSGELASFATFLVLGFLEYATLYAGVAALINRTEDLSAFNLPLAAPIIAAFFIAEYALLFPNATLVVGASLVPLISPFVMFTRLAAGSVPPWQLALAIALNAAAIAAIALAAGKLYRVGLLTYGRPPTFKQIWRTLRT